MKKKVLCLLLILIASHSGHVVFGAAAVEADSIHPPLVDVENIAFLDEGDSFLSIENYPSLMVSALGLDYLSGLDAALPIEKLKLSNILHCNFAALYAIRINQSRFVFSPGVGVSNLQYSFSGKQSGDETIYKTLRRVERLHTECQDIDVNGQLGGNAKVLSSSFQIKYIDFLLRMRFNSILAEPKEGFHTWLGVKFSLPWATSTTISYKEYSDSDGSIVRDGNFNMGYAFGVQAGIGFYRFGLAGGCNFTPLFKKGEGPSKSNPIYPWTINVYIDLL